MGGIGSGVRSGRPCVEDGWTLNLSRLMHDGILQPNGFTAGCLRFGQTGLGFQAQLGATEGWMTIGTGAGQQRLELETTVQPFGGRRWWFRCPRDGRRVLRLHKPPGNGAFASRLAYGLPYRSQRETDVTRATRMSFKLRHQLGDTGGEIGDDIPKPRWMRWRTFNRIADRIDAAETKCDEHLLGIVASFMQRTAA